MAACPTDSQDYDSRRDWVVEVADLLGRSPGALSMHFGNFFSARTGGKAGLTHAGKLVDQVTEEFRDRPDLLQKEAARIRRELYAESVSPRVEQEVTAEEADTLQRKLEESFAEARLPAKSIVIYRRPGSIWLGILILTQIVLLYPDETKEFLRMALNVLNRVTVRTSGVTYALEGDQIGLAEAEIRRLAPKFHAEQLTPGDRVSLALRLPRLKSLKRWKPSQQRLELFGKASSVAERARVDEYYGIDSKGLCNSCLLMLIDALEDGLTSGTF